MKIVVRSGPVFLAVWAARAPRRLRTLRTPLSVAAQKGHEGMVRMLLERSDVNPEKRIRGAKTTLARCLNGHEEVVSMLLEQNDPNPEKADKET